MPSMSSVTESLDDIPHALDKPASLKTTVTLVGHVIDSLTLTKVIDIILSRGGNYLVNEIRVGNHKSDFSYVTLTIEAPNASTLSVLLAEIAPHGARPMGTEGHADLVQVTQAGVLPENAYTLPNIPVAVNVNTQGVSGWLPVVAPNRLEKTLVVDLVNKSVDIRDCASLQVGDWVVSTPKGLTWSEPTD
ncbi:MAG: hypothetical protein VKK59_03490 [Vampirovibrionales bacterium]|nr:hypothetical protein [Vampirovibrionales bacterium]